MVARVDRPYPINERCEICGKRSPRRRLDRDHDHLIEREMGIDVTRGYLCRQCNREVVGGVEYSDEVLKNAIKYMQRILRIRKRYLNG